MPRDTGSGLTRRRLFRNGTLAAAAIVGVPQQQRLWAGRARATYGALQRHFYAGDGTGLYRETFPPQPVPVYSYLWPFSRVLVGTMALAGIPSHLVGDRRYEAAVHDRLTALVHYHDPAAHPAGYDSGVLLPAGTGGDKYYDDAAWIGLALVEHYRMTGAAGSLQAARRVLQFVYPGGWDTEPDAPHPGGVFWVQQGIGLGETNHDRTATSNAPNAELAFHLAQLYPGHRATFERAGTRIHTWVSRTLYDIDGSGLVYDHVRGDGAIDRTLYTYNQGVLVAADVMRYRLTGDPAWLVRAQSLASAALAHFSSTYYVKHSAAFNAIYFRGLLQLHAVSPDDPLQAAIETAMQTYAEAVWRHHRSPEGLYRFADSPGSGYSLLDQGAVLQLFATLAWNAADYPRLA
jgi:Glycosyl hydrolase family 76